MFRLTRTTDKIGWTFRKWVHSPVFEQIRTTDKIGWTHSESEFAFQCFSRSELAQIAEYASRMWVPFQCLSRLKPLTRMAEHVFRKWVSSQDQNYWEEWLNTYPESEFALWYLSRSEPLTRMVEHTYPESEFTPQCFSRSEPLTRMTEHSFRKWVCSPAF